MRFILTYTGELLSSGNERRGSKADHKHLVRQAFHPQLKRLRAVTPFLERGRSSYNGLTWAGVDVTPEPIRDPTSLATRFQQGAWSFVPLVTAEMKFYCGLEIMMLRSASDRTLFNQGDLDGRLKTLLDALSIPDENQGYEQRKATGKINSPLHVLLENDRQITKITVETETLLEPIDPSNPEKYGANDVRLFISVSLSPMEPANWSMPYM